MYARGGATLALSVLGRRDLADRSALAQFLVDQYRKVGIDASARLEDQLAFDDLVDKGDADAWIDEWGFGGDPHSIVIFSKGWIPESEPRPAFPLNRMRFSNDRFNKVADELLAGGNCDGPRLAELFREASLILQEEQPVNFGVSPNVFLVARAGIRGIEAGPWLRVKQQHAWSAPTR